MVSGLIYTRSASREVSRTPPLYYSHPPSGISFPKTGKWSVLGSFLGEGPPLVIISLKDVTYPVTRDPPYLDVLEDSMVMSSRFCSIPPDGIFLPLQFPIALLWPNS